MWRTGETSASGRPIALFINVLSSAGAQRRVAALANRFAELGRTVHIVSGSAEGPMLAMLSASITVVHLPRLSVRQARAYIDDARPFVVMSCVTDTHAVAAAACRASRARPALVLRASRHPDRALPRWNLIGRACEPFKRWKAARRYGRADAIIALSDDGADALRSLLRGRDIPTEVIPNPVVGCSSLDGSTAERTNHVNDVPLVLGVGRLVKQKDFPTLIRAFALVRAERPCRLILLGEGPERSRLEALAARLGIAADVEMPGEVIDVADRMMRAELVVSASLWEGMQAALIEALAAGCPVVATDCPGGARETLDGGRLGILVPVRSPPAMAQAMLHQLEHRPHPQLLMDGVARFKSHGKAELYLSVFDRCAHDR